MKRTSGTERARALRDGRAELLDPDHRTLPADALRQSLRELYERELTFLAHEAGIVEGSGFALVALGGLGRGEVLPFSDLDLLLVHERRPERELAGIADSLWYPLWDSGIRLDHSVRTVDQSLRVAASDISAGLSLLDARVLAGDRDLGTMVVDGARSQWRSQIASRYDDLVSTAAARRHRAGVIAHRSEPDLKSGAGGLRDVQLVSALTLAHLCDARSSGPGDLAAAHATVLDARTELHRISGRPREVLHAQYGDRVAAALGVGDRFDLARVLGDASRTVAFTTDQALRMSYATLSTRGLTGVLRRSPVRRPLAEGVVEHAGEVALARGAEVETDPWLPLRVAAAAARSGLPMVPSTLGVLAERCPPPEGIWPEAALSDLLVLLGAGEALQPVFEALDRSGLWERFVPEWSEIRDLPARDRAHVHTVDRHSIRTVVVASRLITSVRRPDLLLLGALLHDIGKARTGDHCENGAQMVRPVARRLGCDDDDEESLVRIVRHHLVFATVATSRDPRDPETAEQLMAELGHDVVAMDVLAALTEADSLATGPTVWTGGRATVHAALVAACRATPSGRLDAPEAPTVEISRPHRPADVVVDLRSRGAGARHDVTIIVPGEGRSLEAVTHVLAFHRLAVVDARIDLRPPGGLRAVLTVSTRFGAPVDPRLLTKDLRRAVASGLPGRMRDALRPGGEHGRGGVQGTGNTGGPAQPPPWADEPLAVSVGARTDAGGVTLRVRARDRVGLLAMTTSVLLGIGVRIDWAVVRTRGSSVEDYFALSGPAADAGTAAVVEAALRG